MQRDGRLAAGANSAARRPLEPPTAGRRAGGPVVSHSMSSRPAKGGGRWVLVGPERLGRWVDGFVERHGPPSVTADGEVVRLRGADGAVAEFQVPFPPLTSSGGGPLARLISHARRERRVGVLLVRLGGHAAGIFQGEVLVSSKVGSRLVHGRSAAGGWSQRRFARRRENQAGQAYDAAAEVALRILGPQVAELEAVVLGVIGGRWTLCGLIAGSPGCSRWRSRLSWWCPIPGWLCSPVRPLSSVRSASR